MSRDGIHVAVVGLGFGEAFVPLYQAHPFVKCVSVCDPNEQQAHRIKAAYGIETVYSDLVSVLRDDSVDAVHLLTPLPLHAGQAIQVLNAKKHCACAVTMGLSLEEVEEVVIAAKASGKNYMMMETGAFTKEFFFAREQIESGAFGNITFARGDYYQDLEAPYPDYWRRVPPMKYSSHCLGPILSLLKDSAIQVSCVGSGRLRPDICDDADNPFPMQVAHFKLEKSPIIVQINRAWYQTAHTYVESFSFFGEKASFEWSQLEHEDPVLFTLDAVQKEHRWRGCSGVRTPVPYRPDLLALELQEFANGGHGGSHPHLVQEFVASILEARSPIVNEFVAANWTAAGICAHLSSLAGGDWINIPSYC